MVTSLRRIVRNLRPDDPDGTPAQGVVKASGGLGASRWARAARERPASGGAGVCYAARRLECNDERLTRISRPGAGFARDNRRAPAAGRNVGGVGMRHGRALLSRRSRRPARRRLRKSKLHRNTLARAAPPAPPPPAGGTVPREAGVCEQTPLQMQQKRARWASHIRNGETGRRAQRTVVSGKWSVVSGQSRLRRPKAAQPRAPPSETRTQR